MIERSSRISSSLTNEATDREGEEMMEPVKSSSMTSRRAAPHPSHNMSEELVECEDEQSS
jgi:hypothetical protein